MVGGSRINKEEEEMFLDASWLDAPKVFVSSTMEDPTRVFRGLIIDALDQMGADILEFQDDTFPYSGSPTSDVTRETIAAVRTASAFVLIVGKRYGNLLDGKSIVHHEYLEAKSCNTPTFVFIEHRVWADYQRGTKKSDYIESEEHFRFIEELSRYKVWPFEEHKECVKHLKAQFMNHLGGFFAFSRRATWLWNENVTREIERTAAEVWLVTPDFYWDFDDAEFREIVTENIIRRGTVYRYIYRAEGETDTKSREMSRVYALLMQKAGKPGTELTKRLQFLPVKPDDFMWPSEQILFNPFQLEERAILVDAMDVKDKTRKFNIEFGRRKRLLFRDQFISYWNRHVSENWQKIVPPKDPI